MGQKTHPVGFRLQINKNWKSTWFTENSFASELESDVKIRKYLNARLPNAGISKVDISRTSKTITITIFTARPGIVIGKGGEEVNRLKDEVKQLTNTSSKADGDTKNVQINISEIKRPELDAALVGANIAHQLKKKVSYRRVVSKVIQSTMRMGADGIRINVAGRLGGAEIARSEKFSEGRVPLHTLRADIDYVLTEAYTQYGIIGIKVWICNGQSGK
ncbi:MAG: 30S ribosomal protein S3 [Candidatus Neomarinimicrobiota bacterium]|nr:30S ribosomal protein S3 [Candidatus Neomarinimicrobiota bacterium]